MHHRGRSKAPELKGFSAQNLWRMKQFYETYRNADKKLSPLVREATSPDVRLQEL
ncbi:MAG: hypothetical protein IJ249_05800 [Paludibacteraceae bacterium]|nr:hypothetical protein [Paludibacteraceae bacterium]